MNQPRSDDRIARRRVLVVAPFVPAVVASHGASAAMGGMLSALVEHHDVSLIYMRGPEEPALEEKLAAELEIVREVPRPERRGGISRKWSLLFGLLRGRPMWAQQWWSPALAAELLKIVELWQPDIVHVELSVMAPYVQVLESHKPKVVLTVHDPAVPAAMIELSRQRGALWFLHLLDVWAWRRAEQAAARSADQVVVFTLADARTLARSAGSTPICVIPLCTNIPDPRSHGPQARACDGVVRGQCPPSSERGRCSTVVQQGAAASRRARAGGTARDRRALPNCSSGRRDA